MDGGLFIDNKSDAWLNQDLSSSKCRNLVWARPETRS